MLLARGADNVGVIDFVRKEHRTIGFQMTPVKAGAMRCTGIFIPRFATRVGLWHVEHKFVIHYDKKRDAPPNLAKDPRLREVEVQQGHVSENVRMYL